MEVRVPEHYLSGPTTSSFLRSWSSTCGLPGLKCTTWSSLLFIFRNKVVASACPLAAASPTESFMSLGCAQQAIG